MNASAALSATSLGAPATACRGAVGVMSANVAGDGVAEAGQLLTEAIATICGQAPSIVDLGAKRVHAVSASSRLRFLAALVAAQVNGSEWMIFNHVGIARAQRQVPRRWRRPFAVMAHGVEVWDAGLSDDRKAVMRDALFVLASSAHTSRRVAEVHPDLPATIACPLALREREPKAIARVDAPSPHTVVIVGRMSRSERYKGHDQLIAAWPRVLGQIPDAILVCVGRGDDVQRLRAAAADAGVANAVRFPGFVPDAELEGMLRGAALFAMPSAGEGFGFVYLQAMRAELPCLASPNDAAADIVIDGETGLLVEQRDIEGLAAGIVRVLRDAELRRRLGRAGYRRFEEVYTFEAYVDRLRPHVEHLQHAGRLQAR